MKNTDIPLDQQPNTPLETKFCHTSQFLSTE